MNIDPATRRTKGWSAGAQFVPRVACGCGTMFYAPPSQLRRGGGKFCSYKCAGAARSDGPRQRTCRACGTKFLVPVGTDDRRCECCVKKPPTGNCGHCGTAITRNRKHCNATCYRAYRLARLTPGTPKPNATCKKCSAPFYASPGHRANGWGIFCSMRCRELPKHGAAKGGTRADLGIYVRSTWEANYARYLNWLVLHGQIKAWEYEPLTFYFEAVKRGNRSYCPDFRVTENNGVQVFHEVKGYLDAGSKTKLARMKKYYPQHTVILIQNKEMKEIKAKLGALIPHWENGSNDKLKLSRRFKNDLF